MWRGLETLQMATMVKEWRGQPVHMVHCQLHHSRVRYSVMAVVTALWMSILALQAEAQPGTNITFHVLQLHSIAYCNNASSCNVQHGVASLRSVTHYSRRYICRHVVVDVQGLWKHRLCSKRGELHHLRCPSRAYCNAASYHVQCRVRFRKYWRHCLLM